MGKFIVRNGELEGRKFRLELGAQITLGRELGDLNFPDKRMSRRHCAVESRDDGDYIQDLNSTNGTWVNNDRVKEAMLTPGDLIRVGFTELEFLGMPAPTIPAAFAGVVPGAPGGANQTIAFRPIQELMRARAEAEAAGVDTERAPGAAVPPGQELKQRRVRGKVRMQAAKFAAMGKNLHPERRLISAKGKFCEACGEAIFMKEGAPDEGVMTNGLYLCRMCALIAEKQKDLGADYLPSYAKIVGGRMPEKGAELEALAVPAPPPPAEPSGSVEIVESEEVELEEITGPRAGKPGPATRAATVPVFRPEDGAAASPEAAPAVEPAKAGHEDAEPAPAPLDEAEEVELAVEGPEPTESTDEDIEPAPPDLDEAEEVELALEVPELTESTDEDVEPAPPPLEDADEVELVVEAADVIELREAQVSPTPPPPEKPAEKESLPVDELMKDSVPTPACGSTVVVTPSEEKQGEPKPASELEDTQGEPKAGSDVKKKQGDAAKDEAAGDGEQSSET